YKADHEVAIGLGPGALHAGNVAEVGTEHFAHAGDRIEAACLTEQVERRYLRRGSMGRVLDHHSVSVGDAAGTLKLDVVLRHAILRQHLPQDECKACRQGVDSDCMTL